MEVTRAANLKGQADPPDPRDLSVAALVELLRETHHTWLRQTLPSILKQAEQVANAFGRRLRGLHELDLRLRSFNEEILIHLEKEEQVLFELTPRLENGCSHGAFRRGSVKAPIQVMLSDHLIANRALAQIREITHHLASRPDTPPEVGDLCRSLKELDSNMLRHIHLEDEILFPKSRQSEATRPLQ